ncbi:sugar phosphate isomerase/epimerase family protein [Paenibacillus planticolens]|uniref:TIM barrel protein n=1 Tax=Paenibacillus planticolens TaxID=2654976 RepID=A0ABX1ZEN8_9BACL|nr:TIM barrel protein [Paenibacillus planticolens]NOU98556.1 TIM barrel protein [Paenibacillus planticolens]
MKISIGGYSFQNTFVQGKMDVFGYLETVKYRYGLNTVDLYNGFFVDKSKPVWELADDDYLHKIREALDEKEMTVVNFAIDTASLWDLDKEKRELQYHNALKHLRAADILGAKTVRIDTGGSYSNDPKGDFFEMSQEQFEHIVQRYQEYSRIAADFGSKVGPENHMGPSLNPHFLKQIAEAVNHPNFGILLHVDRWKVDPEQGDSIIAPWACHVHFGGKTLAAEDRAIRIAQTLIDRGFKDYWAIEDNAPGNQYVQVEWAVAAMKKVLSNIN